MFILDANFVLEKQEALLCKTALLKKISGIAAFPLLALFTFSFVNSWSLCLNISVIGLISLVLATGVSFMLRTKINGFDYASEAEAHCLIMLSKRYSEIKDALATLDDIGRPMLRCEAKSMCKWVNQHASR